MPEQTLDVADGPLSAAAPAALGLARTPALGMRSPWAWLVSGVLIANLAVVARGAEGVGQALVSDLKTAPRITLQPWARLEGTVRAGDRLLTNSRVHLSHNDIENAWQKWHIMHDAEAKTEERHRDDPWQDDRQ